MRRLERLQHPEVCWCQATRESPAAIVAVHELLGLKGASCGVLSRLDAEMRYAVELLKQLLRQHQVLAKPLALPPHQRKDGAALGDSDADPSGGVCQAYSAQGASASKRNP